MKKILSTLLVGGALLVSLAACGGNGPDLGKEVTFDEFQIAWRTVINETVSTTKVAHIKADVKITTEVSMTGYSTEKDEEVYNLDRDVVNGDHFEPELTRDETAAFTAVTLEPSYFISHYDLPGCTQKFFLDENKKTFGFSADYEVSGSSAGVTAKQVLRSRIQWDRGGILIYGDEETVIEGSGQGMTLRESQKAEITSTVTYVAL